MKLPPCLPVTLAILLLGCAAHVPQAPSPVNRTPPMSGMLMPEAHMHMPQMPQREAERRYRLRVGGASSLEAGAEGQLDVMLQDPSGRPITDLQIHHERVAHFLVVSENLSDFHHLHAEDFGLLTPEARETGRFSLRLTPAYGGPYLLAMDFVTGMRAVHLSQKLEVRGPEQPPTRWNFSPRRHTEALRVTVATQPQPVVAGHPMVGTLALTTGGQPLQGLRQYLGARAHLAVFRERLTASAHLHGGGAEAAPYTSSPVSAGTLIHFEHRFADAGRYRIFLQFQQEETVHTVPLDLRVETPRATN